MYCILLYFTGLEMDTQTYPSIVYWIDMMWKFEHMLSSNTLWWNLACKRCSQNHTPNDFGLSNGYHQLTLVCLNRGTKQQSLLKRISSQHSETFSTQNSRLLNIRPAALQQARVQRSSTSSFQKCLRIVRVSKKV